MGKRDVLWIILAAVQTVALLGLSFDGAVPPSTPSGKLETLEREEHDHFFSDRKLEDYDGGEDYYESSNGYDGYGDGDSGYDQEYNDGSSSASRNGAYYNSNYGSYGVNFFADTQSTYYDGYQQAWRYLGHLVKCGAPSDRYDESQNSQHSGDGDDDDGDGDNSGQHWCQRYLVWAAYVDLNYEGGGIGEYSYYNTDNQAWDDSACSYHPSSSGRCAPMDCHLSNTTTWTLMGVYKEAEYFGDDAFFEQLFKHEGYCLWNDEDVYEFMSEEREEAWPEGCVQTSSYLTDSSGSSSYIYVDLKPTYNGNMTYGLYLDEYCKYEYKGSQISVESVAQSMGLLYGSYLTAWNDALEVYKVCQPCMAYNLAVTSASSSNNANGYDDYGQNYDNSGGNGNYNYNANANANSNGNNQWWNWWGGGNNRRRLDEDGYSYDVNEGYFQCDDDADYTNVNQCMKFRSHAELEVASWEDLAIATEQGGILDINIGGIMYGTEKMSYDEQVYQEKLRAAKEAEEEAEYQALVASVPSSKPMEAVGLASLLAGMVALGSSLYWVLSKRRRLRRTGKDLSEPLEPTQGNDDGVLA